MHQNAKRYAPEVKQKTIKQSSTTTGLAYSSGECTIHIAQKGGVLWVCVGGCGGVWGGATGKQDDTWSRLEAAMRQAGTEGVGATTAQPYFQLVSLSFI